MTEETRDDRIRTIVASMVLAQHNVVEVCQKIAQATLTEIMASVAGGAKAAQQLSKASDEAWAEYMDYIAKETPTFLIGHESKVAKRVLSAGAYRVYEAIGRSNMIALSATPLAAFFDAEPGDEAKDAARVIRHVAEAEERSALRRHRRGQFSPIG